MTVSTSLSERSLISITMSLTMRYLRLFREGYTSISEYSQNQGRGQNRLHRFYGSPARNDPLYQNFKFRKIGQIYRQKFAGYRRPGLKEIFENPVRQYSRAPDCEEIGTNV